MIKRLFIAAVILALFLGGLGYFQFVFKPQMIQGFLSKQVPPPATITAAAAQEEEWVEKLPAIGTLIASQGVDVASQVSGIVTSLGFESGQDVPRGKALVQLDISVELADLASAEATQREADVAYRRQTDLLRKSVASEANVDAALAKRDTAAAAVNRIKALIAQKSILAPFAGRLGIRKVELGQYVSPGLTLVTLQALDPIWVDFPMPEQNISKLKRGQTIELTVDTFPGEVFSGKIASLDARVSQETRTLLVRGTLENPDRKLLPGMFANVAVLAGAPRKVIAVPRTAVTYSLYGDSVYVVKPEETKTDESSAPASAGSGETVYVVERRFVRPGQVRGDLVAIDSGLKAGEQVVTTGQLKLNNGSRVKIDNSQALKPPAVLPRQ
jgi:membrane fusion protein (multidrug efflux system)